MAVTGVIFSPILTKKEAFLVEFSNKKDLLYYKGSFFVEK